MFKERIYNIRIVLLCIALLITTSVSARKNRKLLELTFTINNFSYHDIHNSKNQRSISAEKITFHVSLLDFLEKKIKISAIDITNGSFIQRKYKGNIKLKEHQKSLIDTLTNKHNWIYGMDIPIHISHFTVDIRDFEKNKRIQGVLDSLSAKVTMTPDSITATAAWSGTMNQLGLDLSNGTYFNGAHVSATTQCTYDLIRNEIHIPEFNLKSDQYNFKVQALFDIHKNRFQFKLKAPSANYNYCTSLLSQNLQKKLIPYNLQRPLNVYATIEGLFKYRNNPTIRIDFDTQNNIAVGKNFEVENVNFKGHLINSLCTPWVDSIHQRRKKDIYVSTDSCSGTFRDVPFSLSRFVLRYTPESNIMLSIRLNAEGKPDYLNSLFKNKTFYFEDGKFNVDLEYDGKFASMKDIILASTGKLHWFDGSFFYKPRNIDIPIKNLQMTLSNHDAHIEDLLIDLKNNEQMRGTAEIKNIRQLMIDGNTENLKTDAHITSSYLSWNAFVGLFGTRKHPNKEHRTNTALMKSALKDFYDHLHPTIELQLDTFRQNALQFENIKATLGFKNKYEAHIQDAHVDFAEGNANLDLIFDLHNDSLTYFDGIFEASNIRIDSLFKSFNYFSIPEFANADLLEGRITLETHLKGTIKDDSTGLIPHSLVGPLDFEIEDTHLKNFAPIQNVGSKIFKSSRVNDIYFAKVADSLYIENGSVYFPRMEIRSTAFIFFLEGKLSYNHQNDMWVTIPWKNLGVWNPSQIPANIGYANNGRKFYIQIYNKVNDPKVSYALRFSKKKYYKSLGMKKSYRWDKHEDMKRFRYFKKTNRKTLNP